MSSAKSMTTFRGQCKIRQLMDSIPNVHQTNRLARHRRQLKFIPFQTNSFLRMAVTGSSITQMLHLRTHKAAMGRKCCPMAFLEECSEYFPGFFYSVQRSWKCMNMGASHLIRCLQIENGSSNEQRLIQLLKRIVCNRKTERRCSLVLLYGCASHL